MLALENNLDEGSEKMVSESRKEESESTALVVVPSTNERDISTPSVAAKPAKLVRITTNSKLRVSSAQTVVVPAAPVEPMYRLDIKIRFPYSRVCNRYGWNTYTDTSNTYNSNSKYYVNVFTEEVIYEQPVYTATEVQYTTRIQRAWLLYSAKCKVYRKVLHYKLADLIQGTIKKCAKISYVGYELEGLTAMQMLRRAGYWELSEVSSKLWLVFYQRYIFVGLFLFICYPPNGCLFAMNFELLLRFSSPLLCTSHLDLGSLLQSDSAVSVLLDHRTHRKNPQRTIRKLRFYPTPAPEGNKRISVVVQ